MTTSFRFPIYDDESGVFNFPHKKELKIDSIPEWKKEKNQQPAIYHRKHDFVKPKWSQNKEKKNVPLPIEIEPYASYDEPDTNEIEEINLLSNQGTVQQQLKKAEEAAETKVQDETGKEVETEETKREEKETPSQKEGAPTSVYAQFANSISPEEKQRKQQQEEELAETKDKLPQIKESIQRVREIQRADIPFCRKQTERSKEGRK